MKRLFFSSKWIAAMLGITIAWIGKLMDWPPEVISALKWFVTTYIAGTALEDFAKKVGGGTR